MQVTTIGVDLAKSVFQVHGIGAGDGVIRKRLRRADMLPFFSKLPSCLVGLEACGTAHHWARELKELGHEVKLMPPSYVKPYVKRGKNDATDAEAICEAVTRPTMRFVAVKSAEQQAVLMLHRSRDLLIRQRTMIANALRGHLAEFGIVAAQGLQNLSKLIESVSDDTMGDLPEVVSSVVRVLAVQVHALQLGIKALEQKLLAWHKSSETSQRLETIPGIGIVTATAIAATVSDPSRLKSGRQFAAWLGLVPRQNSSGGKDRLGGISKMGDRYIRRLLVVGATAVIRFSRDKTSPLALWTNALLARRPARLVSVALANKIARVAWAVLVRGENYRPNPIRESV